MALSSEETTYVGLVDDFAVNHDDVCVRSVEQLNDYLIKAVLAGYPLLINDGHMIMHPAIRQAILTPARSPLLNLIKTGYVKILTRNGGDLEQLADEMAAEGITSAQDISARDEFTKQYLPALRQTMSKLRRGDLNKFLEPWPVLYTSIIFHRLTKAVLESIDEALVASGELTELDALHRFRDKFESGRKHRRTDWENAAQVLCAQGKLSQPLRQELMHAGNEAYQYSWGCALSSGNRPIRIATRAPKHLNLDVTIGEPVGLTAAQMETYVPNFKLAKRKIGDNWSKLANLTEEGREEYYAKIEFRRSLEDYYRSQGSADDRSVIEQANKKYSKILLNHFKSEGRARLIFGVTGGLVGAAAGVPLAPVIPAVAAAGVALAITVAFVGADAVGVPEAVMKITGPHRRRWLVGVDLGSRPDIASSFQIHQSEADKYRRGVRRFKKQ